MTSILKKPVYFVIFVVIIVLLYSSVFFVSERELVIVTQFGRMSKVITEPGLAFKLPLFLSQVHRMDKRIQLLNTQPIQFLLGDKNPVIISSYILWKVADPALFFLRVQNSDSANAKMEAMVTSQFGNVLGEYNLTDILKVEKNSNNDKRALKAVEQRVLLNTAQAVSKEYGVEAVDIGVTRISYPAPVTKAVYGRMRSERQKEANKYRAEGSEEAVKMRAKTDKEVAGIIAQAYAEAEELKGKGDQAAMKIYAEAYGQNLEFFRFTKALEMYRNTLKENALMVFSTKAGIFSYLDDFMQERSMSDLQPLSKGKNR